MTIREELFLDNNSTEENYELYLLKQDPDELNDIYNSQYPEIKKEELKLVYKYGEVEEFIGKDKSKIDRVFAFYFDSNGLRDTTSDIRNELQNKK